MMLLNSLYAITAVFDTQVPHHETHGRFRDHKHTDAEHHQHIWVNTDERNSEKTHLETHEICERQPHKGTDSGCCVLSRGQH